MRGLLLVLLLGAVPVMAGDYLNPVHTHTHCWHDADATHAVYVKNGYHSDRFCCFCGEDICVNMVTATQDKHGEFLRGPGKKERRK